MLEASGYGLLPVTEVARDKIQTFNCGKSNLDEFLRQEAIDLHHKQLGLTSIVFHEHYPESAIGYFTLANDGIRLTSSERFSHDVPDELTAFPVIKVGRFAVASAFQSRGIGKQIMDLVFSEAFFSGSLSAARFVMVDAENSPEVLRFYTSLGFERSLWAEGVAKKNRSSARATIKMHKDIFQV